MDSSKQLEALIGERLSELQHTLATAESCTGGLIAHTITNVPGASGYFTGGVIAYSNEIKIRYLGVPPGVLAEHGAVSEPVARLMALNVQRAFQTQYALSATGIAGPGGGTSEKPVGLVYFGLATDGPVEVVRHLFEGGREEIKSKTAEAALALLWEHIS